MKVVSTVVVFLLVVYRFGVTTIDGTPNTDATSLKNGQNADRTPNTDGKKSNDGRTHTLSITLPNTETQSTMPTTLLPLPGENLGFRDIRQGNLLFIDKTGFIRKLIDNTFGERLFFISRPFRFGKTVFLGMLHAFLNGTKELFYNTDIFERGNKDNRVLKDGKWGVKKAKERRKWVRYPVIYIDFDDVPLYSTAKDFKINVQKKLEYIARSYGLSNSSGPSSQDISLLIYDLEKKFHLPVSILIDNYDKPIISVNVGNRETEKKEVYTFLTNFYDQIRANADAGRLRLVFVVGFSKLNIVGNGGSHYRDLTFDDEFSSMIGFTSEEVKRDLKPYVEDLAKNYEKQYDYMLKKTEDWYGGYRFTLKDNDAKTVLNPASICQCLKDQKIDDYLGISRPFPIIQSKLAAANKKMEDFDFFSVSYTELVLNYKYEKIETIPLHVFMLCTGFLTIKYYNKKSETVYLGYPNEEIRKNLRDQLSEELIGEDTKGYSKLRISLEKNDTLMFVHLLNEYIFKEVSHSVDQKITEFMSTHQIVPILRATGVDFDEGVQLWGMDELMKGDLDLLMKTSEIDYPTEVKFNQDAVKAIFQLVCYIIEHEMAFLERIDVCKRIFLLGMNVKSDTLQNSDINAKINEWISVPYRNSKILLNESYASHNIEKEFIDELKKRLKSKDVTDKKDNPKTYISRADSDKIIWPTKSIK